MRSGNEMYCIIFNCLMEVTGIKWQNFAMPVRTQGLHSALRAYGNTKMQQESFMSYCIWRTEVFNSCGVFLVPTPGKKPTQNTFSLQNSHEPESQGTHLEYISKKCQCQNTLLSRLLPWQAIDNFLELECLSRSWGNLSYHLPFCKFWVFYYQWIFYQCLAGVKRHWCTDIREFALLVSAVNSALVGRFQ